MAACSLTHEAHELVGCVVDAEAECNEPLDVDRQEIGEIE
jgi:hypothetical protein